MQATWQYVEDGAASGFVIYVDDEPLDVIRSSDCRSEAEAIARADKYCEDLRNAADIDSVECRHGLRIFS